MTWGASALESALTDRVSLPGISLPQTDHEYNGKFHAVQKALSQKANIYGGKFSSSLMPELGKQGCTATTGRKTLQIAVPSMLWRGGESCMGSKQAWWMEITLQGSHLQLLPCIPQYAVHSADLVLCNLHRLLACLHLKGLPAF